MTITPEILDRLPPHDATAERAVIGAILLDPRKLESVAPGMLGQQFAAIAGFLSLPAEVRETEREDAWRSVLDEVMPHRRDG